MDTVVAKLSIFITKFDFILSKFGTMVMFGTLIFFFHYKLSLIKNSKLNKKTEIDVDSRLLIKVSCLGNIDSGIETPKKYFKFIKEFKKGLSSIVLFLINPILDTVEIMRVLHAFMKIKSQNLADQKNNVLEDLFLKDNPLSCVNNRKIKSCLAIKFNDYKQDKDFKINKENSEIYNKYILPLKLIKRKQESLSTVFNDDSLSTVSSKRENSNLSYQLSCLNSIIESSESDYQPFEFTSSRCGKFSEASANDLSSNESSKKSFKMIKRVRRWLLCISNVIDNN